MKEMMTTPAPVSPALAGLPQVNPAQPDREVEKKAAEFQGALALAAQGQPVPTQPQVEPQAQPQPGVVSSSPKTQAQAIAEFQTQQAAAAQAKAQAQVEIQAVQQGKGQTVAVTKTNPSAVAGVQPTIVGAGEVVQAQTQVGAPAPAQVQAQTNQSQLKEGLQVEGRSSRTKTLADRLGQGTPMDSIRTTASLTTAAAIAGPKPWSRDWVFPADDRAMQMSAEEAAAAGASAIPSKEQLQSLQITAKGSETASLSAGEHADEEAVRSWMQNLGVQPEPVKPAGPSITTLSGSEFLGTLGVAGAMASRNSRQDGGADLGGPGQSQGRDPRGMMKVRPGGAGNVQAAAGAQAFGTQDALNGTVEGVGAQGRLKPAVKRALEEAPVTPSLMRPHGLDTPSARPIGDAAPVVTGHVVQGALAKERLSSEALAGLGMQIRGLGNAGGEVRIRLKPENLGELHLKVTTQGDQVGLQIQASDERAKQIIEESMSHLKDSLATQSLTLGKVDVSVAQMSDSSSSSWNQSNQQQSGGGQWDASSFQGQQQGQGGFSQQGGQDSRNAWGSDSIGDSGLRPSRPAAARTAGASGRGSAGANGRLNVMA